MKLLRRIGIALAGGTVLLAGIVMIVLPAPSILVIPAGLAILAIEFVWARRCLQMIRRFIAEKKSRSSGRAAPAPGPVSPPRVFVTEESPAGPVIHRQARDN